MTVQDVFFIRGRGLVATGRVEAGSVRVGEEVYVNASMRLPVDGIEMFRKVLDSASEGDNVGLLFKGLAKADVSPGDVITEQPADAGVVVPAEPAPPAGTGRDPRFADAEQQRAQLLQMRDAGLTNDAEIDDALRALIFTAGGRQWRLTAGGDWYGSTGAGWEQAAPPG
jgi:hypothetical protein